LVCTSKFPSTTPHPPPWWHHSQKNSPLSQESQNFRTPPSLILGTWKIFEKFLAGSLLHDPMKKYVKEYVKNMKECVENMKKYVENMKEYEEICRYIGFRTALIGSGTWKNSEVHRRPGKIPSSKFRSLPFYIGAGTGKNSSLYRPWDLEKYQILPSYTPSL